MQVQFPAVKKWAKSLDVQIHSPPFSPKVEAALDLIVENYSTIRSIPEISKTLDINHHTLRENFRQEIGLSFKFFLTLVRVYVAIELMKNPDRLIKQIFEEAGFANEEQLERAFRKYHLPPPSVFRTKKRIREILTQALNRAKKIFFKEGYPQKPE